MVAHSSTIMKVYLKIFLLAIVCALYSCKSDADIPWGNSLLYMPQAVIQTGGSTNDYMVPLSRNCGDTSIVVGVYRSGLEPLNLVSVDLIVDTDTLAKAKQMALQPDVASKYAVYTSAELLPASYYDVPNSITISDGEREAYVRLIIHKEQLLGDPFIQTEGNAYILPLRIANPTRYQLNSSLSLTMFIFTMP